jgi:beta-mannosidase
VWPVFSWASVDFYGQWKALHYRGRDSYKDILITVTSDKSDPGEIKVHFLNDKLTNVIASAVIDVMDFNGTSYGEFVFN